MTSSVAMNLIRIIRSLVVIIITFTSITLSYATQHEAAPLWGSAKHGMSLTSVLSVVDNVHPIEPLKTSAKLIPLAEVDDFIFADLHFRVMFFFDHEDRLQLVKVSLKGSGADEELKKHRDQITNILMKRLGTLDATTVTNNNSVITTWERGLTTLFVVGEKSTKTTPAKVFMIIKPS